MKAPKEHVLWHQSGVNASGEPFVQLIQNDHIIGQMTPWQARDHAQAILEAAEAAEQDAFMFHFGTHQISDGDPQAGMRLVMALREYRQKTTGKSQGPRNPKDWVMPKDKPS